MNPTCKEKREFSVIYDSTPRLINRKCQTAQVAENTLGIYVIFFFVACPSANN